MDYKTMNTLPPDATLKDMALHLKSQLPTNIPTNYPILPMFTNIATVGEIKRGITAFTDFMGLFYNLLAEDSQNYDKPRSLSRPGKPPSIAVDFPLIYHTKSVLLNIGYHGILSNNVLSFSNLKTINTIICCEGMEAETKISTPKLMTCISFLNDCGMDFEGLHNDTLIEVTYPDNPDVLLGIKIMATAQRDLKWKTKDEVFLRCDYHALSKSHHFYNR